MNGPNDQKLTVNKLNCMVRKTKIGQSAEMEGLQIHKWPAKDFWTNRFLSLIVHFDFLTVHFYTSIHSNSPVSTLGPVHFDQLLLN